jgi:transposase
MTETGSMTARGPTVLVVDDDPVVRDSLVGWLAENNVLAVAALDGRVAAARVATHRATLRLALIDVNMADPDGPNTAAALWAVAPRLTCWFMTGAPISYSLGDLERISGHPVLTRAVPTLM